MTRFGALCHVCTLLALIATACRITEPVPLPDAAPISGLVLNASPDNLRIRPGSSGRIRFTLLDEASRPVPDYPVDFAIKPLSGDTAGARLGTQRSLTDQRGETVVEIIVGALASDDRKTEFWVEATSPGADPVPVRTTVTTDAYSVEIWPGLAEDLLGLATVVQKVRLFFNDNLPCSEVDIHNVTGLAGQARPTVEVPAFSPVPFLGVAASGVHAVAGLGLDGTGAVRVGGCVDVPGEALLDDVTIRAPLVLDHLFPSLSGTYQVMSDFQFKPPPTALAALSAAWREWSRCQFDPARLWLDCAIAALDPSAAPCVPVAGTLSPLAERLLVSRGPIVSSDSPCRPPTDDNGDPSLDAVVDALFSARRSELAAYSLATLPEELERLLADVRLNSQLTFSLANAPNTYWVEHELLGVSFPNAISTVSLGMGEIGLPMTKASGTLARSTISNDLLATVSQLHLPDHGFTLRLGTTARYAFEASSLIATRKINNTAGLVAAIFGLAQWNEESGPLTGCVAMDAVACARVGEAKGCLLDACRLGLDALAAELAGAFAHLDGDGIDFRLAGSARAIDRNADGQADTLGGFCEAVVGEPADGHGMYGSWQGSRPTAPPEGP